MNGKFNLEFRLFTVGTAPTSTAQETSSAASVSTTETNVTGHSTLIVTVVKIILTSESTTNYTVTCHSYTFSNRGDVSCSDKTVN